MDKNRIQIKTGSVGDAIACDTGDKILSRGQLAALIDTDRHYLYVGVNGTTKFNQLQPIRCRDIVGYFDDADGLVASQSQKYYLQPKYNNATGHKRNELYLYSSTGLNVESLTADVKCAATVTMDIPGMHFTQAAAVLTVNNISSSSGALNLTGASNHDIVLKTRAVTEKGLLVKFGDSTILTATRISRNNNYYSSVAVTGELSVSSLSTLDSLSVTNASTLKSLEVTHHSTVNTLTASGKITGNSELEINGAATFTQNVSVQGNLSVAAASKLSVGNYNIKVIDGALCISVGTATPCFVINANGTVAINQLSVANLNVTNGNIDGVMNVTTLNIAE